MVPGKPAVRRALPGLFLGWGFLNLLLVAQYPGVSLAEQPLGQLSPEIVCIVAGLAVLAGLGIPWHRGWGLPLAGLVLLLRLYALAEALVPWYLNRAFNLLIDSRHLAAIPRLLRDTLSLPAAIGLLALVVAATVAVGWGILRSLAAIHRGLATLAPRPRWMAAGGSLLAALALAGVPPLAPSLMPGLATQVRFAWDAGAMADRLQVEAAASRARLAAIPRPLAGLAGRNVLVLVVESYGQTLFAQEALAGSFLPWLAAWQERLAGQGFFAACRFFVSPTFGGSSWLAFSTLETGIRVGNDAELQTLAAARPPTLAGVFRAAGHRTLSVMPGTTAPWPEGAFLDYDETLLGPDLGYHGPAFGWSPMPDQFVLDTIFRHQLQGRPGPVLVRYLLTSSHAAFNSQPPPVADWSTLGDGALFHRLPPVLFPVTWPELSGAAPAYLRAIRYDLSVIAAYLERLVGDRDLVIIAGDHQPNLRVTGAGAPWTVPLQVISREPALIAPFLEQGYTPGLVPRADGPHPGLETFLSELIAAFSP
ncbi:MAG: hypothetical protein AB1634_10385 [Thermodesulfobacteriota bacterium]